MSAPRARVLRSSDRPVVLANVSRRRSIQGVSALGGLVLAAGFPSALRAADPPKYRADGMPNGLARIVPHHVTRMKVTKSIAPKP